MRQIVPGIAFTTLVALLAIGSFGYAQSGKYPKAKVSFDDYKNLVAEVEAVRAKHLVDLDTFLAMSKEPGTMVLDTRSDFRFDRLHLKGAKHLSFTDFTQGNLAQVIPDRQTRILIYCNNNFDGNQIDFATKQALPPNNPLVNSQIASQQKPVMMALNIPTYISLYGYGYHDIYELNELVRVRDSRISFEGTVAQDTTGLSPLSLPYLR